MRRRLVSFSLFAIALPAVVVALPVVTAPAASARPVAPSLQHIAVPVGAVPAFNAATARGPLAIVSSTSTKPFRAVGISWRHDPALTSLHSQVRVHTSAGWTSWQDADTTDIGADTNGDARSAAGTAVRRDGTDPLWVDRADGIEVHIDSITGPIPHDLRVDLIDPGTSPADATVAKSPAVASARADAAQPTILTRQAWGADESLRQNACPDGPQYTGLPKVAFVHHTVTGNGYAPGDVPAIIRSIYAFHVQGEGWCDVGYNFLVDQYGQIWEGRYGGIDRAVLGAHTGGFNTNSFGVSLIGTFDTATPPQPMVDAASQLIAWKLAMSYANPLAQATMTAAAFSQARYAAGTQVALNVISGHRDADLTACPGNAGYSLLPQIRQQVLQNMGAGFVNPARTVTRPRSVSSNGSVHIVAGMLFTGDWQLLVQDAGGNTVHTLSGTGQGLDTTWDMTADGGSPVPAGVYTLTLSGTQNGQTARPWTSTVVVGGVFGSVEAASGSTGQVSIRGWAARGADLTPAQLQVTVDGSVAGTTSTSTSRPDVGTAYPQYGDNRGFEASEPATPGYHNVCVIGLNDGIGLPNTTLGCIGAVVPGLVTGQAVPRGNLEIAWPATGAVRVGGWALDADTPEPILVHIYVDGAFRAALLASGDRPDVGAAFPGMGNAHGFSGYVTGFYGGVHTVCAYAINAGGGVNPQLGCANVTLGGGNPRGSLDLAQAVPGSIRVAGWTFDLDTPTPITMHVYVDGRWAGATRADLDRPDVGAAFPGYGPAHGFDLTVPVGSGGVHQVCVYAINVGLGTTNPGLGCRTVATPTGPPRGSLDAVQAEPGGARVIGWSLDPDVTAPIAVHLYVDGRWTAVVAAGADRPDVGAAFRGYGAAHGFDTTLTLAAGKHTVCAYGINVGPAAANTKLGCTAVTVS